MSTVCYHTKDNGAFYQFSFERQANGEWRAYILTEPNYRGRNASAPATHRNIDRGRRYVCWNEPLRSEEQARTVAKNWAESTQTYIRTGRRF